MAEPKISISIKDLPEVQSALSEAGSKINELEERNRVQQKLLIDIGTMLGVSCAPGIYNVEWIIEKITELHTELAHDRHSAIVEQENLKLRARVTELERQLREVRSVVGAHPSDELPTFIMEKFGELVNVGAGSVVLLRSLRCTTQDLNATRAKVKKLERQIEKFKKVVAHGERWENYIRTILGIAPAHTPGVTIVEAVKGLRAECDSQRNRADDMQAQRDVAKIRERERIVDACREITPHDISRYGVAVPVFWAATK